MKVRLVMPMSGTRNGKAWPEPGKTITVPDDEGAHLCDAGIAVPERSDSDDVEKRSPRRRKRA